MQAPLRVTITGVGTIAPNLGGRTLPLGRTYAMTAVPAIAPRRKIRRPIEGWRGTGGRSSLICVEIYARRALSVTPPGEGRGEVVGKWR